MEKKAVILFTVLLLILNGCMQKNEVRHVTTPPSALTTAPINENERTDLMSPTPTGTELVVSPNSEISFLEKADFDGDGNDEEFIIRKTDLEDTIAGYIDVSFLKDGETLVYAIEETETLSYQEKVLIANFDADSLPEVFLCTDISGYSRGRGCTAHNPLNRRIPNGMYGGVRGRLLKSVPTADDGRKRQQRT